DPTSDLPPALRGSGGVVLLRSLLAGPRPALAHLVPLDRATLTGLLVQLVQTAESGFLANPPLGRFDELEHADRPALVPAPQGEPERSGRLALHLTGVHHDQRTVAALARGQPVIRNGRWLSLRHETTPTNDRCAPHPVALRNAPQEQLLHPARDRPQQNWSPPISLLLRGPPASGKPHCSRGRQSSADDERAETGSSAPLRTEEGKGAVPRAQPAWGSPGAQGNSPKSTPGGQVDTGNGTKRSRS